MSNSPTWRPRTWAPFGQTATWQACRLSVAPPEFSYFGLWYWETRSVLLGAMVGYGFAKSVDEAKAAAEESIRKEQARNSAEPAS